jgi:hypothetical protein
VRAAIAVKPFSRRPIILLCMDNHGFFCFVCTRGDFTALHKCVEEREGEEGC